MGNMIFNRRVLEGDEVAESSRADFDKVSSRHFNEEKVSHVERRIFPQHRYGGPKELGDPNYRELSNMEQDPLIPQRMRDITRTQLCTEEVAKFGECAKSSGLMMWYHCRDTRDGMINCQRDWFKKPGFQEAVTEEYLNERSHYRQTGIKTKRYQRGAFIPRDLAVDPPLDNQGNYRPQKPTGWDESYPDTPPAWSNFNYSPPPS